MCSLLSFVPFFHEEAKFQQLFFLIFFIFCTILQMWRSNTQKCTETINFTGNLRMMNYPKHLFCILFLRITRFSCRLRIYLWYRLIISAIRCIVALILTSVTSTKTQEEPQTLFAYDSVWRLIWGAKKHARVYYSVWENWMCSTALHDIGGKHYRSRTRLRKNHKSRTATRRAEQTTREKADEFVETKRKIQRTEPRKVLNIQVLHSFQMKHLQPCQQ